MSPSRPSASAAGPAPEAAWLSRRVRSLVACSTPEHRDAGELAGTLQHLDRGDRGAERLRELRLRVDRREAGADHGDPAGGCRGDGGCSRDLHPCREGGDPGVGRPHLAAEAAETAVAGLADAFGSARTSRPPTTASRTLTRFSAMTVSDRLVEPAHHHRLDIRQQLGGDHRPDAERRGQRQRSAHVPAYDRAGMTRSWPPRRPTRSQTCQPSKVSGRFSRAGQSGHALPQAAQ